MVQLQITKNKKTISYLYATTWNQNKNQQIWQLWRWQADSSDKVRRPIPFELGFLFTQLYIHAYLKVLIEMYTVTAEYPLVGEKVPISAKTVSTHFMGKLGLPIYWVKGTSVRKWVLFYPFYEKSF